MYTHYCTYLSIRTLLLGKRMQNTNRKFKHGIMGLSNNQIYSMDPFVFIKTEVTVSKYLKFLKESNQPYRQEPFK